MSLVFFFYTLIGLTFRFDLGIRLLFLLMGGLNCCFILMIPFFSRGYSKLDKLADQPFWKFVVMFIGLFYVVALFANWQNTDNLIYFDLPVTAIVMLIVGIFLVWDFERRDFKFLGSMAALLLMAKVLLQIFITYPGGKFANINVTVLTPAIIEALVAITITFSWFNELRFKNLAKIYSIENNDVAVQEYFNNLRSEQDLKNVWIKLIAKNDLEQAIESLVLFLEKRNEHFEIILNIASRNSRNNTSQLKGVLRPDEYNLSRNQIMASLQELIDLI